MKHILIPHPTSSPGPITAVTADISPTASGCEVVFRIEGDISQIIVPAAAIPVRSDNLWETTCMEFFWQPVAEKTYREYNLSPSTCWAVYDFDDVRTGMRTGDVETLLISTERTKDTLLLTAVVTDDLPTPARVALTVVIALRDGSMQYWSLAFPSGDPDFHSESNRTLTIQ